LPSLGDEEEGVSPLRDWEPFGDIPVTRPMRAREIAGNYEWETGNVIVERFQNAGIDPASISAVLVHGHAPFVWGATPEKAVENAFALEIIAEMAWKALQMNPATAPLSTELLTKHFTRKHGPAAYYGQK